MCLKKKDGALQSEEERALCGRPQGKRLYRGTARQPACGRGLSGAGRGGAAWFAGEEICCLSFGKKLQFLFERGEICVEEYRLTRFAPFELALGRCRLEGLQARALPQGRADIRFCVVREGENGAQEHWSFGVRGKLSFLRRGGVRHCFLLPLRAERVKIASARRMCADVPA